MPTRGASASAAQPAQSRPPAVRPADAKVHRVHAVGEVVGQHRQRQHRAHRDRHLEAEADAQTVEHAVDGQASRAHVPPVACFAGPADEEGAVDDEIGEEAARHRRRDPEFAEGRRT